MSAFDEPLQLGQLQRAQLVKVFTKFRDKHKSEDPQMDRIMEMKRQLDEVTESTQCQDARMQSMEQTMQAMHAQLLKISQHMGVPPTGKNADARISSSPSPHKLSERAPKSPLPPL